MRFDNFPLELKRQIMSHFSPNELRKKIAPVSKEWNLLARDTLNWKKVEFFNKDNCISSVSNILQGTRVEKIKFNFYSFYVCDFPAFPVFTTVKKVIFEYCTFPGGDAMQIFGQCFPNARKLSIEMDPGLKNHDENACFVSTVKYLQQWKNLKSIQLERLDEYCFNKVVIEVVKQDHQLEELILLSSDVINNRTLKIIIDHQGPHLRKFVIWSNSITKCAYQELISCRYLESLSLFFPNLLTDNEFVLIIRELKHLKYFRVESADEIFSYEFRELFKDVILRQLLELVLDDCPKLNDNDFRLIVKNSPLLKRLTLIDLKKITDNGLESLSVVGSNLKVLHLELMKGVTKRCVIKIARELPNLREIVVKKCPQISHEDKFCIIHVRYLNKTKK